MDLISEKLDLILREVLEGANDEYLVDLLTDLQPSEYDKLDQEVSALYLDLKDVIYTARKGRGGWDGRIRA